MIVGKLNIPDRVCLALVSKYFAQIVLLNGTVHRRCWWGDVMFRLEEGWMSNAWRRCISGFDDVFRPTSRTYWKDKLEAGKQGEKKKGAIVSWKWKIAGEMSDYQTVVSQWACGDGKVCPRCWVKTLRSPQGVARMKKDSRNLLQSEFDRKYGYRPHWYARQ